MTRLEYFKYAILNGLLLKREWLLVTCMIPEEANVPPTDIPMFYDGKCVVNIDGEQVTISDYEKGVPLFVADETIMLKAGDVQNLKQDTKTCYGNAMFNYLCLAYPFQDRLEYINTRVNGKSLDALMAVSLKNKVILPSEFTGKFIPAMGFLTVFTQVLVPAATEKYIYIPDSIAKLRDELVKKHGKELHRPEVAALVDTEIANALKEHLKGDAAERHALKGKVYNTVLKKVYGSMGGIEKPDNPAEMEYVGRSLVEGWTAEDKEGFAAMVNSLRSGSYSRGAETALGGKQAKDMARMFQNTKQSEHDCGSKVGLPLRIRKMDLDKYVGRYLVSDTSKPLDIKALKALKGREIIIRDPSGCKTKNGNLCAICLGDNVVESGVGLTSLHSRPGTRFLDFALLLFHSKELKLEEYDFSERLI